MPVKCAAIFRKRRLGAGTLGRNVTQIGISPEPRGAGALKLRTLDPEIGLRRRNLGGSTIPPRSDLLREQPCHDLPGRHLRVEIHQNFDDQPRKLRADKHGGYRRQCPCRTHRRDDRPAINAGKPERRIISVAARN